MRLMLIVVSDEYKDKITSLLIEKGYPATEIASTGEFLQYGETILMLGIEEENVDNVVSILKSMDGEGRRIHTESSVYILKLNGYHKIKI